MIAQKKTQFARIDYAIVATDIILFGIIDDTLHTLLIKMKKTGHEGKWAAPGGLMDVKESPEDAVKRILEEKTGLKDVFAEQLGTFGAVNRDNDGRVVAIAYMALVHADPAILRTTEEYAAVCWHDITDLPKLTYDHGEMIEVALERLRAKLAYTNIVRNILPTNFTLTELQNVYETILSKKMDKRNFRKKILSLGIVKKTDKMKTGEKSRPAALYAFKDKEYHAIDIL